MHMNFKAWKKSLKVHQSANRFEMALDWLKISLNQNLADSSELEATRDGMDDGKNRWPVISHRDNRIWKHMLNDWIHQISSNRYHTHENGSQKSLGQRGSVDRLQRDLIEALLGHGILTEHDLCLLTPVSSIKGHSANSDQIYDANGCPYKSIKASKCSWWTSPEPEVAGFEPIQVRRALDVREEQDSLRLSATIAPMDTIISGEQENERETSKSTLRPQLTRSGIETLESRDIDYEARLMEILSDLW
ncbi:uncharacterized protein PV09_08677 [Verruconis gallopava]|uniref:Uncharacterized protein n=1 Tax=Verruconis gallopava TaxID=253628 RepID=A0A0D1YG03_9PEZI|nr:uncharacterized protein PV09_08677 [Verruconis gallopava]KIV99686.1 hypothetical protein PV09_08677 [Verruconis gallopava]